MKKLALILALSFTAAGLAVAATPTAYSPASGAPLSGPVTRDVCWDQTYDLNGNKISSEIIGAVGLESELADDFTPSGAVSKAAAWGGYYTWLPGDPEVTAYNLRFYDDGGCIPAGVIAEYLHEAGTVTFVGYDGFGYPTYKVEVFVNVGTLPGSIYWLGFQADDHVFPPQWGRQQAMTVMQCGAMFKSAFFAYPDWFPASGLVGVPFDCAQQIECTGDTATEATSWGNVKALYR